MISIVMPVFNAEETLDESLKSILNNGVDDHEVILVDDGSSDSSWDLMKQFQLRHPNVVLHRNSKNLGGGATRNAGIRLAKYPYIFVLDSDDIIINGALDRSLQELKNRKIDGLAVGQSIFFNKSIQDPIRIIDYPQGPVKFEDLISHNPNPVIGNLLFTRAAFEKVGGYPEHHGFDTQGFGFRLLINRLDIRSSNFPMYYQRIPARPSYYMREANAGNLNRNWFYIFLESLYKFSPNIREYILMFPCANARMLAKGNHLFNEIVNKRSDENIFCSDGLGMSFYDAYNVYKHSTDTTLQVWCAYADLKEGRLSDALNRLDSIKKISGFERVLFPFIAILYSKGMDRKNIEDLKYFFGRDKSITWKLDFYFQKILNQFKIKKL